MPRELTEEQAAVLTASLSEDGGAQLLVDTSDTEAADFAALFAPVFSDAGWDVTAQALEQPWGATPTGLAFLSQGDLPLTAQQAAFRDALIAAEVEFNEMDAMLPEGVLIKLLFGRIGV